MPHCLVVDDSQLIRTIHAKLLAELGFTTSLAEHGAEALALLQRTGMPDMVLVDWNMPVMDGLSFVREVRRLPDGHRPKILLCTIESDLAHITQALAEGADEYIMKPFDKVILGAKLTAAGLLPIS
jgi:two-component system chemotaxis response regulator CheY